MAVPRSLQMERAIHALLYASPFFFPLYLLRFDVFGVPFTVLEVFTYLLFGLWLLRIVLVRGSFAWNGLTRLYWAAALTLLLGTVFGALVAPHYIDLPSGVTLDSQMTALGVLKGWVLAPILYFLVLTESFRSRVQVDKLMMSFVVSSALMTVVAYYFAVFHDGVTYDSRLSGFFESANYLSLYLVPAFIVSLRFFMMRSGKLGRFEYINLGALAVMAHALFFTQSYAAFIGVFAAISLYVFYLILNHRSARKNLLVGGGILAATFIILVVTQWNTPKFRQFLDFENRSSSSVRIEVYTISMGLIGDRPLVGVGPGLFEANYQTKGPDILGHAPMEWNIPHPHNVIFAFWLNAGLFGLAALIAFLILAHARFTYPLAALWGMMVHGLFDTPFWKNDLAMIFWLVLGCILILQNHATDSAKKPPRRQGKPPAAPAKRVAAKRKPAKPAVRKSPARRKAA